MKLRRVILALQREGYARKVPVPPDTYGTKQLSMKCLNPECTARATVNFGIDGQYRQGLYNCSDCGMRGDAISLIINLVGGDWLGDGTVEFTDNEAVGLAWRWADEHAAEPEQEEPQYVPSWMQ